MFENHIFNLNDLPLLFVIFQCLLLAVLLPFFKSEFKRSNLLLTVFFLALGITAFDTLIYWNAMLKTMLTDKGIQFFMLFKFSLYITGPSLYFYTKSKLHGDFKFLRRDFLHAIPLIVFPFLMLITLQHLTPLQRIEAVFDYQIIFDNAFFKLHLMAVFGMQILYAVFSLNLIYQYTQKLENNISTLVNVDHSWLEMIIIGFIGLSFWNISVQFTNGLSEWFAMGTDIPSAMGVASNFLLFIFINNLVVYSLVHSNVLKGFPNKTDNKDVNTPETGLPHI